MIFHTVLKYFLYYWETSKQQEESVLWKYIQDEKEKALLDLKILSGLLPIYASCKKIRDDKGYWEQIETYIIDHSEADFSHNICPECANELYPDLYKEKEVESDI